MKPLLLVHLPKFKQKKTNLFSRVWIKTKYIFYFIGWRPLPDFDEISAQEISWANKKNVHRSNKHWKVQISKYFARKTRKNHNETDSSTKYMVETEMLKNYKITWDERREPINNLTPGLPLEGHWPISQRRAVGRRRLHVARPEKSINCLVSHVAEAPLPPHHGQIRAAAAVFQIIVHFSLPFVRWHHHLLPSCVSLRFVHGSYGGRKP